MNRKLNSPGRGAGRGGKGPPWRGFGRLLLSLLLLGLVLVLLASTLGGRRFGAAHELALETIAPVQALISGTRRQVRALFDTYMNLVNVGRQNQELREEIRRYRRGMERCGEAMATNSRLRRLLEFKTASDYPLKAAEIIGKDPSPWFHTVIIDRGARDGIRKGMPVETIEGVVGQVQAVTPNYARVLLAIAPSSAMDVMLRKSRVRGILKGTGKNSYRLDYIQKTVVVNEGDVVVTAAVGGLFPGGRMVGRVSRVERRRRGMFLDIEVTPSVDFRRLENLFVIEHIPPGMEFEDIRP